MAGLSQLMLQPPLMPLSFNPDTYLEQASEVPATDSIDLDCVRMMMIYYEAYRVIQDWRPAPIGLVRTSGDSDEIISALLLEQAALADLQLPRASRRKFAFHMTMAAARYERTGMVR